MEKKLELIEKARKEVSAICKGKKFLMSIPARPNEDSDIIICDGLRAGKEAVKETAQAKREVLEGLDKFASKIKEMKNFEYKWSLLMAEMYSQLKELDPDA